MSKKERKETSKKLVGDCRQLLWAVTLGGLALAALAIVLRFDAALPWISALVGAAWAAYGTICSFYLGMAKSDHREGGITFEAAKANGFKKESTGEVSPEI